MPEIGQKNITIKQNSKAYYKTVGGLSSETFGGIGCFGISTSREEYQQNFENIVFLSEILKFKSSYFMISGALNRFNTSIPQMSEDEEDNFSRCVKLARSIIDPAQFYYQANEQVSTLIPEPAVLEALKIEEIWLEHNQEIITRYNLNIISGSFYIYLHKPELFENFPLQKEIFAKFFNTNPDHKKFREGFKKAAKFIANYYQGTLEQSKNRKFVVKSSQSAEEKVKEFINLMIESVKQDKNGKLYLVNNKEHKFRDGVNRGALKYLERKYNEFIDSKIQILTNQFTINISEQDEFKIETEANKIYNTPYAFACAVLYLLEEYTNFYLHTKRLQFTHYLYLGELKSMPGDKAFKEEILENQSITKGLFKYLALHSTRLEKFEQYKKNIEASYNTQPNGLFSSNSFPGTRPSEYLPNSIQNYHKEKTHGSLIKAKSKTTDDITSSSITFKAKAIPTSHGENSNDGGLTRVLSKTNPEMETTDEPDNSAVVQVPVNEFYDMLGLAFQQKLQQHKDAGSDPKAVLEIFRTLNKKPPSPSSSGIFSKRLPTEPVDESNVPFAPSQAQSSTRQQIANGDYQPPAANIHELGSDSADTNKEKAMVPSEQNNRHSYFPIQSHAKPQALSNNYHRLNEDLPSDKEVNCCSCTIQ